MIKLADSLVKVTVSLAKNILAPLEITAAISAIDAGIKKKKHRSGTITLIIWNEKMNDIMETIEILEDFNILQGITKKIENETKKTRRRIFRNVIKYPRS